MMNKQSVSTIRNTAKRWITGGLLAAALALAGCRAFVADVPTIAPLPTLTPSPTITDTPIPSPTSNVTPTAPLTATPAVTSTPPLGPSATLDPFGTPGGVSPAFGPPVVNYFVATPEDPAPGEPLILFWSSQGATDAFVYRVEEDGQPGRTWTVDPSGSLTLESVAPDEDGTATYVLAVTNAAATVEEELTVALGLACGETWFFASEETDEAEGETAACPDGPESTSQAVYQPFEKGRMFWIGETGEIIILFNDGDEPAWLAVTETGPEPGPDDQGDEPPQGLIRPLRGFGAVWTNNADVQNRLGWATAPESPFETTLQRGGGQIALTGPAGEAIVLLPDGEAWETR
jgi:hypothetical protein